MSADPFGTGPIGAPAGFNEKVHAALQPTAIASSLAADSEAVATLHDALGGGGNSVFGDGSDGDITITDGMHWPVDPADVAVWQPDTEYAEGDMVKNTGTGGLSTVRVYKAISSGVSGPNEPFPLFNGAVDLAPGMNYRGARINGPVVNGVDVIGGGTVRWEQVTAIIDNWLEGPIFGDTVTIEPGVTLNVQGWAIYARTALNIGAGAVLNSGGFDAVGAAVDPFQSKWAYTDGPNSPVTALMGRGVPGAGANTTTDPTHGSPTWGGGSGGYGGSGADTSNPNPAFVAAGNDPAGFTLSRRIPQLWFFSFISQLNNGASIGSGGALGSGDSGNGKAGGAGGGAGSGFLVCAKSIVNDGLITCKGGNGGDGEAGGDTGGGGGGSGGCCVLVYNLKTGAGTVDVSGGLGGAAGTAVSVPFTIAGVNQGSKKFTVFGDQRRYFSNGSTFTVSGSTGNNGTYTVVSTAFNVGSSGNTDIVVVEAIPDATVDGTAAAAGGHATDGGDGGHGDFVQFVNS